MLGVLWAAKSPRPRFIQMFGAAQLLPFDGPWAKRYKNLEKVHITFLNFRKSLVFLHEL
jgi:hypothetical protein